MAGARSDEPPRALGADRIESIEGEEILLVCPISKGWSGRTRRTTVRAAHPGTAVGWEDRIFEVLAADPRPEGGMVYRLAPWEEGQAIRVFERYDAEAEGRREAVRAGDAASIRRRRGSILLAPLAGLLPGSVQKKMESEFGAPAIAMTCASAAPLLIVGFLGMFGHLLAVAGGRLDWPAWLAPPLPIALYLFGESALRLASAIAAGEPMGSLPVVVAYAAWKEARPDAPPPAVSAAPAEAARRLRDRYALLEPVLALLPADSQRALEERYGFDKLRWGRITAIVLLAVNIPNAVAAVTLVAAGRGGSADGIGLVVSGYLVVEQVSRLARLSRREAAGSALGVLVRRMAQPLLHGRGPGISVRA